MTADPFTTAARAEAERRTRPPGISGQTFPSMEQFAERDGYRKGFIQAAEWARDHLAAQEVTDAEVEAAYDALIAHNGPARELNEFHERCCVECGDAMSWPGKISDDGKRDRLHGMRAALSAARSVGRDAR